MNSVNIIGRLTRDPEVRYNTNQTAVASLTVAIDRGKDKDGNDRGADFPRVTVFGKQAENVERYLKKGRLVGISGRIQTGQYQDKNGNTVYTTDVIADRVEFLEWGEKPQNTPVSEENVYFDKPQGFTQIDADIPF